MPCLSLNRVCILLGLICGLSAGLCQGQSLSVLGQKTIRPYAPYAVSLTNTLKRNVPLMIQLTGGETDQEKRILLKRESQEKVFFDTRDVRGEGYTLSIDSLDEHVSFSEQVDLITNPKFFSVYIQLDKPVYKPGDIMSFRVIVIDSDTRPVTNLSYVEVSLKDSKGNSIREWKFAKLYKGVFESSVQLPSSPNLGRWNLTVESEEFQVTKVKNFEVKPYVLPKFWIKVYPLEVPLLKNMRIRLKVESAFTFGRPVSGHVKVDLYLDKTSIRPDRSTKKYFDGTSPTFEFLLNDDDIETEDEYHDVLANVTVTETHTNTSLFILETIRMYKNEFDITLSKPWPMFRPGMPFPMELTFKDKNGRATGNGKLVTGQITYYTGNDTIDDQEVNGVINGNGKLSLANIVPPKTAQRMIIQIECEDVEYEDDIQGALSYSKQYLRITVQEKYKPLRPNKEVQFDIVSSEPISHLTYVLVARGVIVDSNMVKAFNRKTKTLKYKLMPVLAPKARIVVFYTNKEYMIWDYLDLDLETFENKFKISLDQEEKYNPGQESQIDIITAPDSYVALHAIDESVLLLDDNWNDLTKTNIIKEFDNFDPNDNEFDPFQSMGLFLRTTSKPDSGIGRVERYGLGFLNAKEIVHIRTIFPETWLWQNFTMGGAKTRTIIAQVPDTITSWHLTGFALSPSTGLGIIKEPKSFKVEMDFYIVAHLPYSIKRGEITVVQVMIYSFLKNTLITDVYLYNKNDEIEFVDQASSDNSRRSKAVIMTGSGGRQVTFLIKAKKIGEIAIKIEAISSLKKDSVEHILRVEPESFEITHNEGRYIEHERHNNSNLSFSLNIPRKIVDGSVRIEFSLDPSFLRIPMNNVDELIRTPKIYGEANMVDFVPYVVVLDYLVESGIHDKTLKEKMINLLTAGYNNQLKYKLDDGSFCVWNSDGNKKGSIFITSLVAKSFKIATKHVESVVDIEIVEAALRWLASKQKTDGSFVEVGDRIHNALQGVYNPSSYALTAYTLSAFLEVGELASKYSANISSAIEYLVNNYHRMEDLYDLALTAYALSLKKHNVGKKCLDKLFERAERVNGERYWSQDPFSTEIASYAVLTFLQYHPVIEATPIVMWLTKQRSKTGGFSAIQDTFIGLRAMAQYAAKTSVNAYNYRIKLRWKNFLSRTFDINKHNAHLNFSHEIPPHIRQVSVEIDGVGIGMFQIAYQYRLELENAKHGFGLDLHLLDTSTYHQQHLKVCARYLKPEMYTTSNLAYVEVFFPSGLHVNDEHAVTDLASVNKIKNVELQNGGTNIRVFYNSLGEFNSCFIVTAERRYNVAIHRPAYVVVYDSKNKNKFTIQKYDGIINQPCDICQDEDCETMACNSTQKNHEVSEED